jgi:Flp pilus assembly pilin Flp
MMKMLRSLVREESAQDLAEYGIALATISILAGIAAIFIAGDVSTLWSRAQSVIDSAATAS